MRRLAPLLLALLLAGCGGRAVVPTPPAIPTEFGRAAPVTPTTEVIIAAPTAPIASASALPVATYRVVAQYPHDPAAYTQGLLFDEGVLYESTGLYGASSLRRVALESGEVTQRIDIDAAHFGEGLALVGDRLIQLTWQSQLGFVYDRESFELLQTWEYPTEGWGLTYDGSRLIMSDGTDTLYFRDPETLEEIGRVSVRAEGQPLFAINELEMVGSELYANLYTTDLIARIDPASGETLGWIDLAGILPPEQRTGAEDVLNGIAYDPATNRLFVTGKFWPALFEIEVVQP